MKLWFAKDKDGNVITIDEINDENKNNTYNCPMCGSNLTPKATKSIKVTSHFAHVDASKCNAESMIHWWFKHGFITKGKEFTVVSDMTRNYVCKEALVEKSYNLEDGKEYRPDITIITKCGKTIYFEMNYSNKKKIKDYIDIWLELKNIVVEVDIKSLMSKEETPNFKALFYDGKCFDVKKSDTYYNTIGRYKEKKLIGVVDIELKERIRKLDWFWDDVFMYKNGEINDDDIWLIVNAFDFDEMEVAVNVLRKTKCVDLYKSLHGEYKERKKRRETWYFEEMIPKDKLLLIKKAIKKLEKIYKNIDSQYSLSINKETNKQKVHKWRFGRKIGIWKTSSYYYFVNLSHGDSRVKSEYILGLVVDMNCVDEIFNHFEKLLSDHKILKYCIDCKSRFKLERREIEFYSSKSLNLPKRCKPCRDAKKENKSTTGGIIHIG